MTMRKRHSPYLDELFEAADAYPAEAVATDHVVGGMQWFSRATWRLRTPGQDARREVDV